MLNAPGERFVARLQAGRGLVFDGAWHELLMEAEPVRGQAWAAIDAFVGRLAPAAA